MSEKDINELVIIDEQTIKGMIYEIRGQKVMFDFDLARIYGYQTRAFNQQVKRNIDKFPYRYRFQLTIEEIREVQRSQIVTPALWATGEGGRSYLPYVFNEQGLYVDDGLKRRFGNHAKHRSN